MLIPIIYFRQLGQIFKVAGPRDLGKLLPLWLFWGPFYLVLGALKDMYYFLKILCEFKMDDESTNLKEAEDLK